MAKITLHSDKQISATSVSNIFIDEYMSDANGEFVKIYLYLLRLMNAPDAAFSISSIADKFEHTEKDIKRALCYWERMNLLRLEYDDKQNLTAVCLLDSAHTPDAGDNRIPGSAQGASSSGNAAPASLVSPQSQTLSVSESPDTADTAGAARMAAPEHSAGEVSSAVSKRDAGHALTPAVDAASSKPAAPPKTSYTADDIRQFRQDESIAELFFIAERYLGRTLTSTDINTILYLYDGLGFPAELIEYLIESCVSNHHTSIRYIEKVALRWAESHITTVEEAKQSSVWSKSYFTVMNALGISGRNLVPSEVAYVRKWSGTYGFTDDIIAEACQRAVMTSHQPDFKYTDSILTDWHKKQVRHLSDISRLDAEHQSKKKTASAVPVSGSKNKFNNFTQRSYDYDQLEKMLLTTNNVH